MTRKYTDKDRLKACLVLDRERMRYRPAYPLPRKPRRLILEEDGQELFVIQLIPHGRCDQWLAKFPNNFDIVGGMDKILREFKRRNPPRLGVNNL